MPELVPFSELEELSRLYGPQLSMFDGKPNVEIYPNSVLVPGDACDKLERMFRNSLRPASPVLVTEWVESYLAAWPRGLRGMDDRAVAAYGAHVVRQMANFPLAVLDKVLERLVRKSLFLPSIAELYQEALGVTEGSRNALAMIERHRAEHRRRAGGQVVTLAAR